MGFITAIIVRNDSLEQIANDKDFGRNLVDAIRRNHPNKKQEVTARSGGTISVGAAEVIGQSSGEFWVHVRGNTAVIHFGLVHSVDDA
jgi:hypothetical protein